MTRELLFSVSVKDCEVQVFKGSGAGGQKRNKTSSGIRIIHHPSGAIGRSTEAREQHVNKEIAFKRMVESKEFKAWHKMRVAEVCGLPSVEERVEGAMQPKNLRIELVDEEGNWVVVKE